jgi:hypothetical protein
MPPGVTVRFHMGALRAMLLGMSCFKMQGNGVDGSGHGRPLGGGLSTAKPLFRAPMFVPSVPGLPFVEVMPGSTMKRSRNPTPRIQGVAA